MDERVLEEIVDEEISIGDYVLTGGELPAMVLIDCVSRLVEGVLPSEEAYSDESHYDGLLEYPQYTRPPVFMSRRVPDILLSGHHANIQNGVLKKTERTRQKGLICMKISEKKREQVVNPQPCLPVCKDLLARNRTCKR